MDLGLDLLFDGDLHTVQAIVFHTNCPGHAYFALYRRAAFRIQVPRTHRGRAASRLRRARAPLRWR